MNQTTYYCDELIYTADLKGPDYVRPTCLQRPTVTNNEEKPKPITATTSTTTQIIEQHKPLPIPQHTVRTGGAGGIYAFLAIAALFIFLAMYLDSLFSKHTN